MSEKSWTERYEERKASRLAEEKTHVGETRGFSFKDLNNPCPESISVKNENIVKQVKTKDENYDIDSFSFKKEAKPEASKPILNLKIGSNEMKQPNNIPRPSIVALKSQPINDELGLQDRLQGGPGPPPTPDQLIVMFGNGTSSSNSPRPSRPNVPTPSKYGTTYGGGASPGPNPSRNFNPPGYVPPTPPAGRMKPGFKRNVEDIKPLASARNQSADSSNAKKERILNKPINFHQSMKEAKKDASLSSSSWEEEYLARKKARQNDS